MKNYFTITKKQQQSPMGAVGGVCSCAGMVLLEIQAPGNELDDLGFSPAAASTYCTICGKPYKHLQLDVQSVTDVTPGG